MSRYRFADYVLDPQSLLLERSGAVLDVPRRVFDCLALLLAERQRAVGRDELIRRLWGRDNVSDNQLAQTVAAARRLIDDDGVAQRLIRTVPGFGYHWIGAVEEVELRTPAAPPAPTQSATFAEAEPASAIVAAPTPSPAPAPMLQRRRPATGPLPWLLLGAATLLVAFALQRLTLGPATMSAPSPQTTAADADPLQRIRVAIRHHAFDSAREWLAQLPAPLVDGAEARHLEIELDLASGRLQEAAARIAMQLAEPGLADAPIAHARLLLQRVSLRRRLGEPGWQEDAEAAVALLGPDAPALERAHALFGRGVSNALGGREEAAQQDFVAARTLYLEAGDPLGAADAGGNLARLWVRSGRLAEALEQLSAIADTYARSEAPGGLLNTLTSMSSIQVSMLRWPAALASSDRARSVLPLITDASRRQNFLRVRALVLTGMGRLREASTLLVEAEAEGRRGDLSAENRAMAGTFAALWSMAAGDAIHAQQQAAAAFAAHAERVASGDTGMRLDARDQALLLWLQARQWALTEGLAATDPDAAALAVLDAPQTNYARIARGRWLTQRGELAAAETMLRAALDEAYTLNRLARMLTASEALVDALLQGGKAAEARSVVQRLLAFDPATLEQDYDATLLALRVAVALDDADAIASTGRRALALAGERIWPRALSAAAWNRTLGAVTGVQRLLVQNQAQRSR